MTTQAFSDKGVNERRTYTVDLVDTYPAGLAVVGQTFDIAVSEDSLVDDPNPGALLDGIPQRQGTNVLQALKRGVGVIDCTYVLTFGLILENADTPQADFLLTIRRYSPSGDCGCS